MEFGPSFLTLSIEYLRKLPKAFSKIRPPLMLKLITFADRRSVATNVARAKSVSSISAPLRLQPSKTAERKRAPFILADRINVLSKMHPVKLAPDIFAPSMKELANLAYVVVVEFREVVTPTRLVFLKSKGTRSIIARALRLSGRRPIIVKAACTSARCVGRAKSFC